MNFSRWFLSLILLGLSSAIAMADSVDPKFVPIGGGGSIIVTSLNQDDFRIVFTRNGDIGTVDCGSDSLPGPAGHRCIDPTSTEFVNLTGRTWDSITLEITKHDDANGAPLTFAPFDNADSIDPYFAHSASGFLDNHNAFVRFFGIDSSHPGIQSAFACPDGPHTCTGPTISDDVTLLLYDFSVLSDVNEMTDGQSFTAQITATAVPEPATVLLALGGGLLLLFFKRT